MNRDERNLRNAGQAALELSKRLESFANTLDVERINDHRRTAREGYSDLIMAMKRARIEPCE